MPGGLKKKPQSNSISGNKPAKYNQTKKRKKNQKKAAK